MADIEQVPQTEASTEVTETETKEEVATEEVAAEEVAAEETNQTEQTQESAENVTETIAETTAETTAESTEELEYIRDPILDQEEMRKMFVGGIAPDSTDDELQAFFEEISGGVVEDKVVIRKESDKKNHFGFITFATSELVDEVLLKREQLKFKDRQLDVNRAVPKYNTNDGAHDRTKKLFIANLPKLECSSEDLQKYFEARHPKKYGTIEKIQLIKEKGNDGAPLEKNKGFGFILVSSEDLADKMAIQHQHFEFGGRKIELKKSVESQGGKFKRGGGRGGGGGGGHMYGGNQYAGNYGGGYGPYYGGAWDYSQYGAGFYDYGAYGGGYGGPQGGAARGRGGGGRYRPY